MSRSQRLIRLAVALWAAAIIFLALSGLIANGLWLIAVLLTVAGIWAAHEAETQR